MEIIGARVELNAIQSDSRQMAIHQGTIEGQIGSALCCCLHFKFGRFSRLNENASAD